MSIVKVTEPGGITTPPSVGGEGSPPLSGDPVAPSTLESTVVAGELPSVVGLVPPSPPPFPFVDELLQPATIAKSAHEGRRHGGSFMTTSADTFSSLGYLRGADRLVPGLNMQR